MPRIVTSQIYAPIQPTRPPLVAAFVAISRRRVETAGLDLVKRDRNARLDLARGVGMIAPNRALAIREGTAPQNKAARPNPDTT